MKKDTWRWAIVAMVVAATAFILTFYSLWAFSWSRIGSLIEEAAKAKGVREILWFEGMLWILLHLACIVATGAGIAWLDLWKSALCGVAYVLYHLARWPIFGILMVKSALLDKTSLAHFALTFDFAVLGVGLLVALAIQIVMKIFKTCKHESMYIDLYE